jgi:hypothetical protein
MDTIQTIGSTLKKEGDYERDAIHIAIMPVIVDDDYMAPGSEVKFVPGSKDTVRCVTNYSEQGIGIIDPYINRFNGVLRKGDKVWLFLRPNSVTGMRHHWKHPGIDDQEVITNQSEIWLLNFADRYGMAFDEMVQIAKDGTDNAEGGDCIVANAVDIHSAEDLDAGDYDLFWTHMEAFTNMKFDDAHRKRVGWSCTC